MVVCCLPKTKNAPLIIKASKVTKKQRKKFLAQAFGIDRGKISSFSEADRTEDSQL